MKRYEFSVTQLRRMTRWQRARHAARMHVLGTRLGGSLWRATARFRRSGAPSTPVPHSVQAERDELLRCVRELEAAIYAPDLPAENDTERLAMVHGSLRSTLMWICDRRGYPEGGLDA